MSNGARFLGYTMTNTKQFFICEPGDAVDEMLTVTKEAIPVTWLIKQLPGDADAVQV